MTDHEKLKGLAKFIVEFSKQPGNEWLYDELFSLIEENSTHNILNEHPKIQTFYNHCVEDVLQEYADKLYDNFKFKSISEILKVDLIKMEKARQNGNLKLFILHCFQQAEAITNYIFQEEIAHEWEQFKLQRSKIIYRKDIEGIPSVERVIFTKYTNKKDEIVDELDFFKKNGWTISKKFEVVFYTKNAQNKNFHVFLDGKNWFRDLNNLRNWAAHRGKESNETTEKLVEKYTINPIKYFTYFTNGLLNLIITNKIKS